MRTRTHGADQAVGDRVLVQVRVQLRQAATALGKQHHGLAWVVVLVPRQTPSVHNTPWIKWQLYQHVTGFLLLRSLGRVPVGVRLVIADILDGLRHVVRKGQA